MVEHLDRRIITAAGVSSGIDMALRLVELLVDRTAAEAAQLMIEYDPQPPFDSGSLAKAGDAVMAHVVELRQPALVRPPLTARRPASSSTSAEMPRRGAMMSSMRPYSLASPAVMK